MEPLKNYFNKASVLELSGEIKKHYLKFDEAAFLKDCLKEMKDQELKGRVKVISSNLKKHLPNDFVKSTKILVKTLKSQNKGKSGVSGFGAWPLTQFVSDYGEEYFDESLLALKLMTVDFTSEFAIRGFIIRDHKRCFEYFDMWVKDDCEHVRRLVSEGTRPLLPWGEKITLFEKDPTLTWKYLDALRLDNSVYVQKSVSNHLNDHSKNHVDFVLKQLTQWNRQHPEEKSVQWMIRHASRTLIKKGELGAFSLFGINHESIEIVNAQLLKKKIVVGQTLEVKVKLLNTSKKIETIIVDSELSLLRANGKHNVKCFKGKQVTMKPKEEVIVELKIPIREVTTRKYYPGVHYWNPVVNGRRGEKIKFMLE